MAGACGDCDACCRIFEVEDREKGFFKPWAEPCKHLTRTALGPGCGIYKDRPDPCGRYMCVWLASQLRTNPDERMPERLQPNNTKVVLGNPYGIDREVMNVYPLPGFEDNWRFPPVSDYLQSILKRGAKVVVVVGGKRIAIRGDMAIIGTEEEFERLNA